MRDNSIAPWGVAAQAPNSVLAQFRRAFMQTLRSASAPVVLSRPGSLVQAVLPPKRGFWVQALNFNALPSAPRPATRGAAEGRPPTVFPQDRRPGEVCEQR